MMIEWKIMALSWLFSQQLSSKWMSTSVVGKNLIAAYFLSGEFNDCTDAGWEFYWSCYKPFDAENFILLALLGSTNLHIKVHNYSGFEFVYEVNLNLNHAFIYYK